MRDPIEELENFTIPGPPMTPLPAAEVRRRGTRLRRRNTALATAGGLAVVAAIVAPVAFLLGGHPDDSVQPAPPAWRQSVPEGFPLAEDMFSQPPVTGESGADDIVLCGTTVWSPDSPVASVDVAGARYEENEAHQGRTLAVYPDEKAAEQALDAIRQGVEDCPRDENGGGLPLVNDPLSLDLGGDDWFAVVQQAKQGQLLSDLTVWEIARFGNALLLDSSYGSAGGEEAIATASRLMSGRSEAVRARMCVFSADPCGEGGGNSQAP